MSAGARRLLVVYETEDAVLERAFGARLAAAQTGWTLDEFSPELDFTTTSAPLIRDARARVAASDAVICLLGGSSATSQWQAWALQSATDLQKRAVCVRLHDSVIRDAPPPYAVARRVPILHSDPSSVAAYVERGELAAPVGIPPLASRLAQRR